MPQIETAKGSANGGSFPLPAFPHDWANGQRVSVGSSNGYSAVLDKARVYNIKPTVDCYVTVSPANSGGTAVAASASAATSWPLAAFETYTIVLPNLTSYLGVIRASTDGVIYIHPAVD